jgi:hypothetical protein
MKKPTAIFLAGVLAIPMFAQPAAPKPAAPSAAASDPAASATIPASAAVVTAPLVLKDGAISQPQQTELPDGGKATFNFTVPKAGNYVIHAEVNAPGEDANSFFVNIDAPPEDPLMIWDFDVTAGFEDRIVSWRGKGEPESDEFKPKVFKLSAGAHKLFIVGREPAQLKSVSVRPAAN